MANIKNRRAEIKGVIVSDDYRRVSIIGTYNKKPVTIRLKTTDQWAHLGIRRAL